MIMLETATHLIIMAAIAAGVFYTNTVIDSVVERGLKMSGKVFLNSLGQFLWTTSTVIIVIAILILSAFIGAYLMTAYAPQEVFMPFISNQEIGSIAGVVVVVIGLHRVK